MRSLGLMQIETQALTQVRVCRVELRRWYCGQSIFLHISDNLVRLLSVLNTLGDLLLLFGRHPCNLIG